MLFYATSIMRHPRMANPTLLLLSDRNDLDDQLFDEVFSAARTLPETPTQAESRDHLKSLLTRASGGIIFTTLQKFGVSKEDREAGRGFPMLSERRNIVVIADEAHRSQYDFVDGLARNLRDGLPNACFIGFTGTPIEQADKNTPQVFGDYIDIYDLTQAVEDGATVRVFYEARLAKVELPREALDTLDEAFEAATEGTEEDVKARLRTRWARVEAIVGSEKRIKELASDILDHWESRSAVLRGKALIVCMSRRICANLYTQIVQLRPSWHSASDIEGKIKVVITGSAADDALLQPHIRNKEQLRALKQRAKDPENSLELIIVRDMWLTGFDSPSLHTMYVDKPMRGAGLMQAIARVNRTFRDKPAGLVVDYIGIAGDLEAALADYTRRDRERGEVGQSLENAVLPRLIEKHEVVCNILNGYDWESLARAGSDQAYLHAISGTANYLFSDGDLKSRFMEQTRLMVSYFTMSVPHPLAMELREDVAFFQAVRTSIAKIEGSDREGSDSYAELDTAIRQIVSEAISGEGVIDIYARAGLPKPDLSLIDEEFIERVRRSPQPNLQIELLRRLLNDELRSVSKRNLVADRKFSEMLERSLNAYQNRSVGAAEVIAELVALAIELKADHDRGKALRMSDAELAFYDAVSTNESAVIELGDTSLQNIARELAETVRRNATIDWQDKETVRARLRSAVRRLLIKHKYPPDKREETTDLIIGQAELVAADWTGT
jgi:type I restriction enzyme R subunit